MVETPTTKKRSDDPAKVRKAAAKAAGVPEQTVRNAMELEKIAETVTDPEAKAARTAAATAAKQAKQTGGNVARETRATEKKRATRELAKKYKVPAKQLEDAATVLEAAEKAPEGSPLIPAWTNLGVLNTQWQSYPRATLRLRIRRSARQPSPSWL